MKNLIPYLLFATLTLAGACHAERAHDIQELAGRPLALPPAAVLATANDWIALPDIRASDGAIVTFNVLSMRDRGLLQVQGTSKAASGPEQGKVPALAPWFAVGARAPGLHVSQWRLIDDWIPVATAQDGPVQMTISYATPPRARAAWIREALVNRGATAQPVRFGLTAHWGGLARVIYSPSMIIGQRLQSGAPGMPDTHVFSFVENETALAWALAHPDCQHADGSGDTFRVGCQRVLAPGQSAVANFVVSVGLEETSAEYGAHVLAADFANRGDSAVLDEERAWIEPRLRTTGDAQLDQFMNRNLLFSSFFAWGRTLDTEQFVGVTSRSPRYYVSAAYWDRDAMLWSFPALLRSDVARARSALDVALGIQLRDTGTHSRFIDGTTLEPGYELDENAAPIIALAQYWSRTHDSAYLMQHQAALAALLAGLVAHRDGTGLFWTQQDAQDQTRRSRYETYDNVLVWRALQNAAMLYRAIGSAAVAQSLDMQALQLRATILHDLVAAGAPGSNGPIFAFGWDGQRYRFDDVPPGSLLRLPALGFISQDDPLFRRTYQWLHSSSFEYSNAGKPYGLPGSYRLPDTTSWSIADHLRLRAGQSEALKILRASPWDAGIVSEQIDPATAESVAGGGAFATAAGYLADTVCELYCRSHP